MRKDVEFDAEYVKVAASTASKLRPTAKELFAFKSAAVAAGKELAVIRTAEFREVRPQQG